LSYRIGELRRLVEFMRVFLETCMLVMHVHTIENFSERYGVQRVHLSNRIQVFLFNLHELGNK